MCLFSHHILFGFTCPGPVWCMSMPWQWETFLVSSSCKLAYLIVLYQCHPPQYGLAMVNKSCCPLPETKMGKSSIFWLLFFLRHDSAITAEAITIQMRNRGSYIYRSPVQEALTFKGDSYPSELWTGAAWRPMAHTCNTCKCVPSRFYQVCHSMVDMRYVDMT